MAKHLTIAALLTLALAGCSGGATLVRKDARGGRVALEGAYMPAMGDARLLMVEHCRGRFEADERGTSVEFRCRDAKALAPAPVELAAATTRAR